MNDKTIGTIKTLDSLQQAHTAVGSIGSIAGQTVSSVTAAIAPGGNFVKDTLNHGTRAVTGIFGESRDLIRNPVTEVGAQLKDTGGKLFQFGFLDKLFAGVTFGVRAIEAGTELHKGNNDLAVGKITRGTVEAGIALVNLTGIGAVAQIGTKLATGKFASEHAGEFVEAKAVDAYRHFFEQGKPTVTTAHDAAVAVMPFTPPRQKSDVAPPKTDGNRWQNKIQQARQQAPALVFAK